ncbi:MFS transporter [Pendulispora brunnea]|uniref:MFS transporter n=1 Tax=Pendulispora brunnea TaxID=2905690 RepID=A0ABZ2JVU1_9BACT
MTRGPATWLMYAGLGYFNYLTCAMGPALPLLRGELAISYTVSSLHFTAFAVGLIFSGSLVDRVAGVLGRRATFWLGIVGLGGGGLVIASGTHASVTIAGALAMGIFGGGTLSMTSTVLSEIHGAHQATALTEANLVASAAGAAAPLLVGWLASATSWRAAFVLPAAVGAGALFALRRMRLPEPRANDAERVPRANGLGLEFWTFWAILVLVDCIEFSMAAWASTYLRDAAGFSAASAATAASLFLIGMLAGRGAGTRLLLQGAKPRALLKLALLTTVAGFLLFRLGPVASFALVGLLLTGVGVANLWPLALSLALGAAGDARDAAASRASLAAGVGAFSAPLALGAAADGLGIANAYWLVVPLVAAAWLLVEQTQRARALSGTPNR